MRIQVIEQNNVNMQCVWYVSHRTALKNNNKHIAPIIIIIPYIVISRRANCRRHAISKVVFYEVHHTYWSDERVRLFNNTYQLQKSMHDAVAAAVVIIVLLPVPFHYFNTPAAKQFLLFHKVQNVCCNSVCTNRAAYMHYIVLNIPELKCDKPNGFWLNSFFFLEDLVRETKND